MNNSKQINLDDIFDLVLEEMASAGYQISLKFNDKEFELIETKYLTKEVKKDEEVVIGNFSTKVFTMKSLKKGDFKIESHSQRVFEKNVQPKVTEVLISVL